MKDIVVLAGSTPWSVLSLCKCATKHKSRAFVVCVKNGWGKKYTKSRYVHKAYDTTEADLDVFWQGFFAENSFEEKPILYVTSDYVCQQVERKRVFYEVQFELCMASSYIICSFIDKNLASVVAEKHGLTVPRTQEIHSGEDVAQICRRFKFPVIVKPVTFHDHNIAKFKTQICDTEQQLQAFVFPHLANGINLQCQEYIKGEDKECVFYQFYRNKEGRIVECMGEKTMQTNGIMTIGTTKYDPKLAQLCRSFLQSVDYKGIGGIEFKKYGGEYYFIEMSTRTEGFLPISDMAGVSLAEASLYDINGLAHDETRQKEGKQYVVFMPFLRTTIKKRGFLYAFKQFFRFLFSYQSRFVGAYLDLYFALKLDLRII